MRAGRERGHKKALTSGADLRISRATSSRLKLAGSPAFHISKEGKKNISRRTRNALAGCEAEQKKKAPGPTFHDGRRGLGWRAGGFKKICKHVGCRQFHSLLDFSPFPYAVTVIKEGVARVAAIMLQLVSLAVCSCWVCKVVVVTEAAELRCLIYAYAALISDSGSNHCQPRPPIATISIENKAFTVACT
jgi:hypothetical protein